MPISGDYCYCFAVAFGNDTCLRIVAWGMEGHPVTDSEALHLLLHARLLEVAQAYNDLSVELCELGLAEFCDVDGHSATISNCCGSVPAVWQQFLNAAVHVRWQSCQHVMQIGPRVMTMQLGRLQQAHYEGGTLAGG